MSGDGQALLRLEDVDTFYGPVHILQGLSLEVHEGELVCLLGGNASGKSTTLKTILGIVRPRKGRVLLGGEDVTRTSTSRRIAKGIAIVPENRRLFAPMTVRENLQMGAYLTGGGTPEDFDRVYELFPRLHERRNQLAGTLSGGEQQMVAMARALMGRPKLMLMDEPSMGLAPVLVEQNFRIIKEVHESGVAILVVEQNANVSLSIADRGYVLSTGRLVLEGKASELLEHEDLRKAYLGRSKSGRFARDDFYRVNEQPIAAGGSASVSADAVSEADRLAGDLRRLLDRENRGDAEAHPRHPRRGCPGDRRRAVRLDDRDAAAAVGEAVEALELGALRRLPLREDAQGALLALLRLVGELPHDVKEHHVLLSGSRATVTGSGRGARSTLHGWRRRPGAWALRFAASSRSSRTRRT